jgi:hypothetical protein
MSEQQNPKKLLMDLQQELDGETLEHVCLVHGFQWKMRLLNEEESNWRNGYVNTGTKLSAVTSWRLPTLAIGIRAIGPKDGELLPTSAFFQDEWRATAETRAAAEMIEGQGAFSQKYFTAEYLMEWLAGRFPEALEPLYAEWQKLEKRREDAQASVKKSSGESSEEEEKDSGTELSPSGEK